ncbi:MAG TPA: hypothetical protein VFO39_22415 [Candidatus Sulfotelmatobacter sp.]|nr:hypothetical protein [Candidatus Sulfotelmatobacter sp.]
MSRKTTNENDLRAAVQHAVERVLADQLPRLQEDLVQRVLESLPASGVSGSGGNAAGGAGNLVHDVASIHQGTTQKEILRALLDRGGAHCARIALFVVKAGSAVGWQGRGFENDEAVKDFPLDMGANPVSHAYHNRVAAPANSAEMDRHFVEQFGAPSNEQVLMLPLVLKDKVAALVYADGGNTGSLDAASLELLVVTTSAWLEVVSLRKQSQREGGEAPGVPAPVQAASSFSDPFAGHAPKHVAPPAPEPAVEVVEVGARAAAASAAAPAAASDPFAALSPEDAETHRKAQRFARLLVDEIKLYNQAKVSEGRRNRDLYDRLKEDIEKSRTTYQKRYGSTAAASGDYFQKEVVRSLAEDDLSVMGANFKN